MVRKRETESDSQVHSGPMCTDVLRQWPIDRAESGAVAEEAERRIDIRRANCTERVQSHGRRIGETQMAKEWHGGGKRLWDGIGER